MKAATDPRRAARMAGLVLLGVTCVARVAAAAGAPASQPYNDTQSALSPAGAPAADISALWWRTFWILTVVYAITLLLTVIPAWLRRARTDGTPLDPVQPEPMGERFRTVVVGTGVGITVIILFVLLVGDFAVGNRARALGREPNPVDIEVTGHQWWWEVRYMNGDASKIASDANEVHVPVGRPVRVELKSGDVIHSFWVPNVSGKKDLVPGHPTSLALRADRAGTYWGQCAEFCGYQHAKMRLAFVAQEPAEFEAWLASARESARAPSTDAQKRGMQVFMGRTCSTCHTIQGTQAGGRLGPDLTHIASRATIAAGSLPNTMGHRAGWIVDPQGIKPGTKMPQQQLSPGDLQDLSEYLENLK